MTNRLLELEKNLSKSRAARRPRRTPPPAGAISPSAAPTSQASSLRRYRPARAFGAVSYTVPGLIETLQQPSGMTCWATCFTMMMDWYHQRSMSIETALRTHAGDKWADMFLADKGLTAADKVPFLNAASPTLVAVPPSSHSIEGYCDLLRAYGPLWVTTNEAPVTGWAIHARIMVGIDGDGTPAGTFLDIVDPGNGTRYKESFDVFWPKFEDEARRVTSVKDLRIQIVHFSQHSVLARAQSSRSFAARPRAFGDAPDLASTITNLRAQGISQEEIEKVLNELGVPPAARAYSLSSGGTPITIPTASLRPDWQTPLILAAITAAAPPLGLLSLGIMELANRLNVTIGVGPAVAGGVVAGAGLGAGIVFAPGRRIGFYGSASVNLGAIISAQVTAQVTVIHGGPSNFAGNAVAFAANISTATGITGGVQTLFSTSGAFLGVTGEVGLTAGLSPFEAFAGYQAVGTTLSYRNGVRGFSGGLELSDAGLQFIARHEGLRTSLYNDPAGHCTVGYGHLVHSGNCDARSSESEFTGGITQERALEILRADAAGAAGAVRSKVTAALNQCQFDALVSFVFNIGAGAFASSTLLRRLNAGEYDAVPTELARWVNAGGKKLPGLVTRRQHEANLFSSGIYDS